MRKPVDISTPLVRLSRDGASECEFVNFIPDLPDEHEPYSDEPSGAVFWVIGALAFWTGFAVVVGAKLVGAW